LPQKNQTIGIILNPRKEQVVAPLDALDEWISIRKPGVTFLLAPYGSKFCRNKYTNLQKMPEDYVLERADLLVTLGGDGTILRTVQAVGAKSTPVLGVNLGGLGFLAETPPELLIPHLQSYLQSKYVMERRSLLQCTVPERHETHFAFNDLVLDKAGFSRVIEIITMVDGRLLNSYIADALILSTPTGSTGYSLSAGGPIVIPETRVFLINPICPHSLTNRPVVIPDESTIQLTVYTEHKEVYLFRDGQMVASYPSGTVFEINKAPFMVNLVKMKSGSFFETLRNKLHWGEDFRDKKRWSYQNYNGKS